MAESVGWTGRITLPSERLPESLRSRLHADQDLVVATERLRALGYQEPVSLRDGLIRAIEWEREQERGEAPPDYRAEDHVLEHLT